MNKSFIFDWSGTLSDNFHCFSQVCNLMFKDLGKEPLSDEELKLSFCTPYMKFWNEHFPHLTKEEQDKLYEKYINEAGDPELYQNVREILGFLKENGWKIFVISSDPISKLIPETKYSGLSVYFEKVIGETQDKAEVVMSLLDEFKLDRSSTFIMGDTDGDVEAGKIANIKTIGITWGFQHKDILSKTNPDFLIDDIIELKEIINRVEV